MNDTNSLERRCSFNLAQGIPIAESTHLNGSSFSWGSVSPKVQSYSNLNSTLSSYYDNEINASSKNTRLAKIDARIAADVQSKGLASRIVKYQETGTRLNRSMSAHNLFSKPGQFPTVTLKKTNLPYRAAKREVSMIRIPPPDKSSFYGNTVSSLLRSSSVIGLQSKQNEDLSTENRPIIHPPPTENDMAPTRSVLDVLKEISRKRINSDELESEETSKKYCSHARNDFVDSVANKNFAAGNKYFASHVSSSKHRKRQRDCITSQQGVQFLEVKTSPEQAKKRICNYNNDITSSLSSSVKSKKKPMLHNLNHSLPTNFLHNETQNSKDLHKSDLSKNVDIRFRNLENHTIHTSKASVGHEHNNSAVTSQSFASETFLDSDEKISNDLIHTVDKPRLTLFNKKYDDNESKEESKTYESEEKNNDCTGIPFVKPKKIASKSGLRNPVIERTQKSKLALMLSGLRGELYQNSDLDEIDSSCEKKKLNATTIGNTNISKLSPDTNNSIPTLTTVTSTTTIASTSSVETPTNIKTTLSSTSSPLVGLKLKSSSENVSNISRVNNAKDKDLHSRSNVPLLGGFPLAVTCSSSTPVVQSCSNHQVESKITPVETATIPITITTETTKPASAAVFTLNGNINKIAESPQLPISKTLIQFPAVCAVDTLSTSNANTASTPSTLTVGNTFTYGSNLNNSKTHSSTMSNNILPNVATSSPITAVSSTNAPVVFDISTAPSAKPINVFNFSKPSTSSPISTAALAGPIVLGISTAASAKPINAFNFSTPTSSPISTASSPAPIVFDASPNTTNLPKTTSTCTSAVTSSAVEHKTVGSSATPFSASSSGLLNFNANNKSSNSEMEKYSGNGISTSPFNKVATINTFGINPNSINLKFDGKNQISGGQSNQKDENKGFSSSSPVQFDSQCLNTKVIGSPISVFNGTTRSDNNIFNPSGISVFGLKSVKDGADVYKSNSNDKSEMLVLPTGYANDETNKSKSLPFSFISNANSFAATNSNNLNTPAGGFSFSSAASNSKESGQTDPSNQTFTNASVSQNNFLFGSPTNKPSSSNIFGLSTNKPENLPHGGFSFGPTTSIKASTFTFGTEKASKSDAINANNPSTGFAFGAPSEAKSNVLSTNKPFSFGSPQPAQQKQAETSSTGNSFNIFGLTDASKATQPPVFKFTSESQQTNTSTNIFAPPNLNVTTGPGDRLIRRATRRLQK